MLDECHYIKNLYSQRTQSVHAILTRDLLSSVDVLIFDQVRIAALYKTELWENFLVNANHHLFVTSTSLHTPIMESCIQTVFKEALCSRTIKTLVPMYNTVFEIDNVIAERLPKLPKNEWVSLKLKLPIPFPLPLPLPGFAESALKGAPAPVTPRILEEPDLFL